MKSKATQTYNFVFTGVILAVAITLAALASIFISRPYSVSGTAGTADIALPGITLAQLPANLDAPLHITHAGDDSRRLFIVEQGGAIRIFKDGALNDQPFLDIHDRVLAGGEQGLLSVAFPPDYTNKGYFYVYYTTKAGDNRVSRFSITGDADLADAGSETIILPISHPIHANHNGGQLAFGPDGYLYIGVGDGGGAGDPDDNAQDPGSLLGKILRIDVEQDLNEYKIPPDNPFVGASGYREEIWAMGLRNPWRFSFDRQAGDLYIGDVGQGSYEEINFQPANSPGGENYGWDIMEGPECYGGSNCNMSGLTLPVYSYATHVNGTCSVTGGFVYRGAAYPGLQGIYIFGDYCSGAIWGLSREGGTWQADEFVDMDFRISSFGEDQAGELYMADIKGGAIYAIQSLNMPFSQYFPAVFFE